MPIALGAAATAAFDIVGLGVNTTDLLAVVGDFPAPDSKHQLRSFTELPGGETATALSACARLGWRARYVGRFGRDERGRAAQAALAKFGVDISACDTVPAAQPVSVIVVDNQGRRTVLWDRDPALDIGVQAIAAQVVASGRIFLADAYEPDAAAHAARCARRAGIPTILDIDAPGPGQEALLETTDILITSAGFPEAFTGQAGLGTALRTLATQFRSSLVCATVGAEGSVSLVDGVEIRTTGFQMPVVDTTGAGDAFRGGFIAGWLAAGAAPHVEEILVYANAVAALACRRLGARGGLPTRVEVDRLVSGDRQSM